jgi:hypothetical protein
MPESSISYGVVTEVSRAKGVAPDELRPLHDVVDPDALEALFDRSDGESFLNGHVSFTYEGYIVEVRSDEISVRATDELNSS